METPENEVEETPTTMIAATANISAFTADDDFSEWLEVVKHELWFFPPKQQTQQLLRALPRQLHIAAVRAGLTPDTDLDECCSRLFQIVVNAEEIKLAREFFHRNQKLGEDDETYAENLRSLSRKAFKDTPLQTVESWIMDQFKHGVRPYAMLEKLREAKANSIQQLVKMAVTERNNLYPISRVKAAGILSNYQYPRGQQHNEHSTLSHSPPTLFEVTKCLSNAVVQESLHSADDTLPTLPPFVNPVPASPLVTFFLHELANLIAPIPTSSTYQSLRVKSEVLVGDKATSDADISNAAQEAGERILACLSDLVETIPNFDASNPALSYTTGSSATLGIRPHECNQCKKSFSRSGDLKRHIAEVHMKLKPYTCNQCDKSFSRSGDLKVHVSRVHRKLKLYECNQCDKSFSQSGHLKVHLAEVHKKLKPHECNQCDQSFSRPADLKRHIFGVHRKLKPYKCNQCDKFFSRSSYLKEHVIGVHRRLKPHACNQCDKSFSQSGALKVHITRVHKGCENGGWNKTLLSISH